jgi:hypothetical protein
MKDILEALVILQDTPVPNLFVVAGIAFLLLGFVGKIGATIELSQKRQKWAGIIGGFLLFCGILLFVIPGPQSNSTSTNIAATDTAQTQAQPTEDSLLKPRTSVSITVEANIEWQNTRVVVEEGELVQITNDLSGRWRGTESGRWTNGSDCTPSANSNLFLLPTAPGGSLIAKVNDSAPVCVGNNLSLVSMHSGVLYLSYNDCPAACFSDNEGSLTAQVEVFRLDQ